MQDQSNTGDKVNRGPILPNQGESNEATFHVSYDSSPDDIIGSMAYVLRELGIDVSVGDDGKPHDGYTVYVVRVTDKKEGP